MSTGPIPGHPIDVLVERRAPGGEWATVVTFVDHECPLGVVPEYNARRPTECQPFSCTEPMERRQQLAEAIEGAVDWASADVVGRIVEAVLPFVRR